MKRWLLMLLFLLPLVSAINLDINSIYSPGETIIGSIEGNFISPITSNNFYFYSDRSLIPIQTKVAFINDKYYFYGQIPSLERNYTLIVKNLHYLELEEKTGEIEKNFSVSGNISDFSVSPGFIIENQSFSIKVKSILSKTDISAAFENSKQNITLSAGQEKELFFNGKNSTFSQLTLKSENIEYLIPVSLSLPINNTSNTNKTNKTSENHTISTDFKFSVSEYNFTVNKGKSDKFSLYLLNNGDKVENISFSISDILKLAINISPSSIDTIKEGESARIEINVETSQIGTYKGKITALSDSGDAEIFLSINSIEQNTTIIRDFTCISYGGIVCSENQQCAVSTINSSDGACCIGICNESTSYTPIVIGISIVLLIAIGVYFLYTKSKNKEFKPEEMIEERKKKFESRISPNIENRDSLSRF
jgi:hypothetical protein